MSYRTRLTALISRGYFPRELPPTFTTDSFGQNVHAILADWEHNKVFSKQSSVKVGKKFKNGSYTYQLDSAEAEVISKPKRGYERRDVHLTHPVPQALLSSEVSYNWSAIQKWLSRQTFSLDRIDISYDSFDRAISGINFDIHRAKIGLIEATSDWVVKTDISRFYPTIYTHSIPWAAYGKAKVKGALKLYGGSLADRLDILVRACNRNQTVGIPVGPETSRIIAEIISSRIDADFQQKMPKLNRESIDRLQDDWFVGLKSLEEAETVLSKITSVYRDYGLDINGSKTSIGRVIAAAGSHWVSELGAFLSHRTGPIRGERLRELISLALRMQATYPTEPVTNYVLGTLESQKIEFEDVATLESFLLKSAVTSPISLDRISRILINVQHWTKKVSLQRVGERFTYLAEANLENGNVYEVIWLLYTLRGLGVKLSSNKIRSAAESTNSSVLALTLLDMASRGSCVGRLPKNEWAKQITEERIGSDWIWLLGYEGIRHGWLQDINNAMGKPFFSAMASRDVSFYDPRRNVLSSKKAISVRKLTRQRERRAAKVFVQHMRGFEFGDY